MNLRIPLSSSRIALLMVGLTSLTSMQTDAATYTYSKTTSGTDQWAAGTNWSATPVSGADTILTLNGTVAASVAVITNNNNAGAFQLNRVNFDYAGPATGTAPTVTVSGSAGTSLNFVNDSSSTAPFISVNATGTVKPTLTISSALTLTNALTVDAASGNTATISGNISGSQGLTKQGSGTLILSGSNTTTGGYTGTVTINGGTLRVSNSNAVGAVNITSGALNVDSTSVTLSGGISGAGQITKTNSASTLTLNGTNTHTGGTTLSDGAIIVGTGTNNGLGTGTLTIGRGRFGSTDNNARTIDNPLAINISGGLTLGATQGAVTGLGDLTFTDTSSGAGPGNTTTIAVNNATTVTLNKTMTGAGSVMTKNGTGTLNLNGANSSYGGITTVNNGILGVTKLSNGGSNSSIGAATNVAGNLVLSGGTLKYTGTGDSTNKLFTVRAPGGTIDASGASNAAVNFTGTGANVSSDAAARTITYGIGSTSATITASGSSDLVVGMTLLNANLPGGTATITAISGNTLTLSAAATASATDSNTTFGAFDRVLTLTGSSTGPNTIAGVLADSAGGGKLGVTKNQSGTWILSGNSTHTGNTTVNAGKLVVNGTNNGSAGIVNANGRLGGSGTLKNLTLNAGGAIEPGNSIGTLNTNNGDLTWNGEAGAFEQMKFELDNTAGLGAGAPADKLALGTGVLTKGGGSNFTFDFLGTGASGNTYTLLTFGSSSGFNVSDFNYDNLSGSLTGTFALTPTSLQFTTVPEPGTWAMLIGGLGLFLLRQRRSTL